MAHGPSTLVIDSLCVRHLRSARLRTGWSGWAHLLQAVCSPRVCSNRNAALTRELLPIVLPSICPHPPAVGARNCSRKHQRRRQKFVPTRYLPGLSSDLSSAFPCCVYPCWRGHSRHLLHFQATEAARLSLQTRHRHRGVGGKGLPV